MKQILLASLILLGSGCATLSSGPRFQSEVLIGMAQVVDQSTGCSLGITEITHGKMIRGNSCSK